MALQTGRVQRPPKGSRGAYEDTYTRSRSNLLLVMGFTLINIIFALLGQGSYFLFSATVPYFVALIGRAGFDEYGSSAFLIIAGVIALVMLGVYFLFWCITKRHRKWMDAATVCFGLDCVGLVFLFGLDVSMIIDYAFHVYVMYYLVTGSIAAHKLAKMPPEEPVSMDAGIPQTVSGPATEEIPADAAPADAVPAEEASAEEVSAEEAAEETPAEETQNV